MRDYRGKLYRSSIGNVMSQFLPHTTLPCSMVNCLKFRVQGKSCAEGVDESGFDEFGDCGCVEGS